MTSAVSAADPVIHIMPQILNENPDLRYKFYAIIE